MARVGSPSGRDGHDRRDEPTVERRVRKLFDEALGLAPGEQRGFLAGLEESPAVRRRLAALLERDDVEQSFLDGSILDPVRRREAESVQADASLSRGASPSRIDGYRIEARIAVGGTSVVYLARNEEDPASAQVAIKWIREEWADGSLHRDLREARFLSRLDHPGIARLLDVGIECGRPFFVMEYVHGVPITEYCDERRLSIEERLLLFEQVCAVVSHAHQNLIVHRDLKPANILVTPRGEPKLLDFGISAFFDPRHEEPTATLPLLLTPAYASPEQIGGRGNTTASDVYSLGVLLFELLGGERPYDWSGRSRNEVYEVLRRDDPPLASRLVRESDGLGWRAAARRSSSEALARRLRGDLDNILRKAMRFDPGDSHAHTVEAYDVLTEVIFRAGDAARAEAPAHRVLELSRELYGPGSLPAADAANNLGAVLWASGRYDESAELYRDALVIRRRRLEPGHPRIGESLNNLGNLHMNLAQYERAEELLREALEINTAALGEVHPLTVSTRANLANVLSARGDYDTAERLYREALVVNRETLGEGHPEVAILMHNLADLLALRGRPREALDLFVRTEALRLAAGEDNARLAATQLGVARALHLTGELAASEAKYVDCLDLFRRELGAESWRTANAMVHYAELLADLGRLEEAERAAREAVAAYATALAPDHWRRAVADSIFADIEARRGEVEQALPRLEDAWARLSRSKGEEARQTRDAEQRLNRWTATAAVR
jgi:serine/threonine-protein kinase